MSYWLRLYTDILNDAKIQKLPPEQFKYWVNLLCLAKENDGVLPAIADIAYRLHIANSEAEDLATALKHAGLIDEDGDNLTPHNWEERQYADLSVSTERVKRFREKRRNGVKRGETFRVSPETPETFRVSGETPETQQSRAEQIREETEQQQSRAEQSRGEDLPAAAASEFSENHSSGFSFSEIEDFVRSTKPWIKNPGGFARKLWRSGEEDDGIKQWKAPKPRDDTIWPKWVFDPKEPGTIEDKKRFHLQLVADQEAREAQFNQEAASGAA